MIKNPIYATIMAYFLSFILIFIIAVVVDSQYAAGQQYFLIILVKGMDYQAVFCYGIFILSSIFNKDWFVSNVNKILYTLFAGGLTFYVVFLLFFNHQ